MKKFLVGKLGLVCNGFKAKLGTGTYKMLNHLIKIDPVGPRAHCMLSPSLVLDSLTCNLQTIPKTFKSVC